MALFLPARALSSLWQLAHGRDWYRDDRFERRAYRAGARRAEPAGPDGAPAASPGAPPAASHGR